MNRDIEEKELDMAINKTKKWKAPGPEDITNEMIKNGKESILKPMCNSLNRIKRKEEERPEAWRKGNIKSIWKGKGKVLEIKCQRGLSLTSAMLKCFEKIIGERINPTLKKNATSLQGGGKTGESCEEYLFIIQTLCMRAVDK